MIYQSFYADLFFRGMAITAGGLILIAIAKICLFYFFPSLFPSVEKSCLYYGRVKHTRLKGGAIHHLDYPIFFSYLDLQEMEALGLSFWPIFSVNLPYLSFCSFDYQQHLKDFRDSSNSSLSLPDLLKVFVSKKSDKKLDNVIDGMQILTHLTYFGYCFNPISIYYLKSINKKKEEKTVSIIAEVSNTPWIEMHSYLLHQDIPGVESYQYVEENNRRRVDAVWKKEFHVSPFMEMDYKYAFSFYEPGETVVVHSKMVKLSTNEVWFTANFDLQRMPFTPLNLLYVLLFYPMQTRLIQIYIHYEAVLLYLKGVPTFNHPNGTDVDFGFGITGARIASVLWFLYSPIFYLTSIFTSKKQDSIDKKHN